MNEMNLIEALRVLEKEPLVTIRIAGYRESDAPQMEIIVWKQAHGLGSASGHKYYKIINDEADTVAEIIAAAEFCRKGVLE